MKKHERRAAGLFPYFKLATWDERSMTFRDGKIAYSTRKEAESAPTKPGRYRVSRVTEEGREDARPFEVWSLGCSDCLAERAEIVLLHANPDGPGCQCPWCGAKHEEMFEEGRR